jgi:hypothetical protein
MAQPPGTARYFPYENLFNQFITDGEARAVFEPSGVAGVYWFGMTVAFSGSVKFGVWDPVTDVSEEIDIQFLNGSTHYVSASSDVGKWDLYTPDSVYPVLRVGFEPSNGVVSYEGPDTWIVDESFSGVSVSSVEYVLTGMPAGLGYPIPVYVLCFCSSKPVPEGEEDLEISCGCVTLYSTGAEPMMMVMSQMSVVEQRSVIASARQSDWFRQNVTRILELVG